MMIEIIDLRALLKAILQGVSIFFHGNIEHCDVRVGICFGSDLFKQLNVAFYTRYQLGFNRGCVSKLD